jgi:predicted amidohydrolase YtcJ
VRLFRNLCAYAFDPKLREYRRVDRFLVDGATFASFECGEIGTGNEAIDLRGATVVPAFADCHVHLTDTGYLLGERDLGAVRSAGEFADRVAALPAGETFLLAGNYDESTWHDAAIASAEPLDRAHAGAFAMLVRIDGHSCLVNQKTLAWLDLDQMLSGIERDAEGAPTGRLSLDANWRAQARFLAEIPEAQRRAAERRTADLALSEGALHLHAQLVGFAGRDAYAAEIEALRSMPALKWYPKICERDPALAKSFGLPFVGGDVFLDGSIGSGTAAMTRPYADRIGSGVLTLDDTTVEAYFAEAEALGMSAGVHAIGDAAIEQCIAAWERVLDGKPSPRNRHFVEHFEVATPGQIARCARLGIYLSMQPQFDALWGGAGGMYERRLGSERMRTMNALRTALRAGATLCGGDDSPVCRLSPLAGMAAACEHHNTSERLTPLEALTMYTYDAARLGHAETHTGALLPGFDADFVVLDNDPFADGSFSKTRVLQTWKDGACVHDREAA